MKMNSLPPPAPGSPAAAPDFCQLTADGKTISLLGTAHVSRESAERVNRLIQEEQPDTVAVELCASRYHALTRKEQWENTDLIKVIRERRAFLLLANLMLSSFQKRIGHKLGIKPGEEMVRAMEAAEQVGAGVHLADRDIRITLSRTWRLMSLWKKIKLMGQLVMTSQGELESLSEADIEQLKTRDVLEGLLSEIGEKLPEVRRVLIDERDQYLAHKIQTAPGRKIVAVVGAGHLPGIRKHWGREVSIDTLEEIPPRPRFAVMLKWLIPAVIVALIAAGFFHAGTAAGTEMIKWWVLANALFAGLGAAAALAHPLTIASAVLASPLTSVNPMIAAGWVSGLVETLIGKPKVRDFERLPEDIISARGFWRNKITRILLVVIFTNIGSSVGSFVAIPLMLRVFA